MFATYHYLTEYEPEEVHPKMLEYPWLTGFASMISVYVAFWLFFEYILRLKHIGTFDNIYLHDTVRNKPIITAVLYFDKFDHTMLNYMKERMLKYRRLRSVFSRFLDQYYLKELSGAKFDVAVEKAYVRCEKNHEGEPLSSDKALSKFLEVEAARGYAEDEFFYRLYSVENYSETESVMMFSCHHALADGMSL